jgi:hypothetical protein
MFGREIRMLLRHYLEQGTSKCALARQLGVSRDRWLLLLPPASSTRTA